MDLLFTLLIVVHIFLCVFLVLIVLLQSDKGGGLAGAFGGMGGGAAFSGGGTATFLTKLTQGVALTLFVIILALTYLSERRAAVTESASQLQEASKGLSGALPSAPVGQGEDVIPGLGTVEPPAPPADGE